MRDAAIEVMMLFVCLRSRALRRTFVDNVNSSGGVMSKSCLGRCCAKTVRGAKSRYQLQWLYLGMI